MEDLYGRVLFDGYAIIDGAIVNQTTGKTLCDKPIEDLDLSVRAYNVLNREGIHKVSDFIGVNTVTIINFKNMGIGTVNELLAKLNDFENSDNEFLPPIDKIIIAFRWRNKVVWDIPFDNFTLSVRSRNRMDLMKIKSIKQFLEFESLSSISGLGQKSIEELASLKEQAVVGAIYGTNEEKQSIENLFNSVKAELLCLYTPVNKEDLDSAILGSIFDLNIDERTLQNIIDAVKSSPSFTYVIENKETALISERLFNGITVEEIAKDIGFENDLPLIETTINNIIAKGIAYKEYDKIYFSFPSIIDVLSKLTEQEREVMNHRLNGKTLEEIGKLLDFTRERIRQIVEKSYEKLFVRNKHADIVDYVKEDKYKYFYETYSLEKEDFCEMTSEAEYVWNYLSARYESGQQKLSDALTDEELTLHLKYGIQRFINKDFLILGTQRIPLVKSEILNYVLSIYCIEDTSFDELIKFYNGFLDEHNLPEKYRIKLRIEGENVRTLENKLNAAKNILWKLNRRLRYYNMDEYDFSELLQAIDLKKYHNIELSSEKFFKEFSDLMQAYDIRDEYELHNLLKKIYPDDGYVVFSRMPTIKFGEFDRSKAVLDAICLLSPVSADDLATFLNEEYGHKPEFLKSGWLPTANLYFNNGIYSIENKELPQADFSALKRLLTEDFYYVDEVKEIYKSVSNNYDDSLLSTYNLKRLGFTPYCNYIIRKTMSADGYFKKLLTANDIFDASEMCSKFAGISAFYSCLAELKSTRQIIEYEPYHFINIRFLNNQGITEKDLQSFCDEVFNFVDNERLFSFKQLFNEGFTSKLQELGFLDWFYASILREDARFTFRKMNGGVLFIKGNKKVTRVILFDYIFVDKDKMGIEDLIAYLFDVYGFIVPRDDIFQTIAATNLYYDPISMNVYRN